MPSTVLLLGDLLSKGRVAVRAMTTVLEARGHEVLCLPTALISHTLNLGHAQVLDTTDYLLQTLRTWEMLHVDYDFLCIGYVTGSAQAHVLARIADEARAKGKPVLVDPILGDGGKKYNAVTEDQVEGMRELCEHADLITPNLTEAGLLTGCSGDVGSLCNLLGRGKSVLITGCPGNDESQGAIIGWDARRSAPVDVRFARIPGHHFGTGDMFSAVLVDALLSGAALEEAARRASMEVADAIRRNENRASCL